MYLEFVSVKIRLISSHDLQQQMSVE